MLSSKITVTPTVRSATAVLSETRPPSRSHALAGSVVQPTRASTSSTALERSRYKVVPSANRAVNMADT